MNKLFNKAVSCLCEKGGLLPGQMIVLGCSTSEAAGGEIGRASVPELGEMIAAAFIAACVAHGIHPAFQCCEHLNRALVMEREALFLRGLTEVSAIPKPKAGGSAAAAAWLKLKNPALAMSVQAEAAIDIGDTLVGMHIRPVAVPVRLEERRFMNANLVMAYSRLPLIGGERAEYR